MKCISQLELAQLIGSTGKSKFGGSQMMLKGKSSMNVVSDSFTIFDHESMGSDGLNYLSWSVNGKIMAEVLRLTYDLTLQYGKESWTSKGSSYFKSPSKKPGVRAW